MIHISLILYVVVSGGSFLSSFARQGTNDFPGAARGWKGFTSFQLDIQGTTGVASIDGHNIGQDWWVGIGFTTKLNHKEI